MEEYRIKFREKRKRPGKQRLLIHNEPSQKYGPARVLSVDAKGCTALINGQPRYINQIPDNIKQVKVIVGDLIHYFERSEQRYVADICQRRNALTRLEPTTKARRYLGANIDRVFILSAVSLPKPRLAFTDRVILACECNAMEPVLIFNKVDSVNVIDLELKKEMEHYVQGGYTVLSISALNTTGLDRILKLMKGKICLFCGQSGVGKTTLMNALVPDLKRKVGKVSDAYQAGRHVTSDSLMVQIHQESFIVDTPGIKTFEIPELHRKDVIKGFREFDRFSIQCKFSDCRHDKEPDCAVRDAALRGVISKRRYEIYIDLFNQIRDK